MKEHQTVGGVVSTGNQRCGVRTVRQIRLVRNNQAKIRRDQAIDASNRTDIEHIRCTTGIGSLIELPNALKHLANSRWRIQHCDDFRCAIVG